MAIAAQLGLGVDVNQATEDDWLRLPGLSIHQARRLVQLRRQGVAFWAIEDVAAALGLPPAALAALAPALVFRYYPPLEGAGHTYDLNQATTTELLTVPGLSPMWCDRILHQRQQAPFQDWADCQRRCAIPPDLLGQWFHYLHL